MALFAVFGMFLLTILFPSVFGAYKWTKIARHPYGLWAPDLSKTNPVGYYDSIYGDHFYFHLNELDEYLDPFDDKYHFKLNMRRFKGWDSTNQIWYDIDPMEEIELEWSQSSWIQSDTVIGFEQENDFPAIEEGAPWNGAQFTGLHLSDY